MRNISLTYSSQVKRLFAIFYSGMVLSLYVFYTQFTLFHQLHAIPLIMIFSNVPFCDITKPSHVKQTLIHVHLLNHVIWIKSRERTS